MLLNGIWSQDKKDWQPVLNPFEWLLSGNYTILE